MLLGYALLCGLCVWVRSREVRPKAERQGFLRPGGVPDGLWFLERVEHRDGVDQQSMRAVRTLIDARVPPGQTVGAAPASDSRERDLIGIGFVPTPGSRGHVVLDLPETAPAPPDG